MAFTIDAHGSLKYRAQPTGAHSPDDVKFQPVSKIIYDDELLEGEHKLESEKLTKDDDDEMSVVFSKRTDDVGTFVWRVTYSSGVSGTSIDGVLLTAPDNVIYENDMTFDVGHHDDSDTDID